MRLYWQPTARQERAQVRVTFVRVRIQAGCQQVLASVVRALGLLGGVVVALVEATRDQDQAADVVTVFEEVIGRGELSGEPLGLLGP